MKKIIFLFILAWMFISPALLKAAEVVGVSSFEVQGPSTWKYLGVAAQDALLGVLVEKGITTLRVDKTINPDKLYSARQAKSDLLLAGRINIVGEQFRVFLKWVDKDGNLKSHYLKVSQVSDLLPSLEAFAKQYISLETTVPPPNPPQTIVKKPPLTAKLPRHSSESQVSQVPQSLEQDKLSWQSPLLPYEVRGMARGDVDGDGKEEILLTEKNILHVYSYDQGQLQEMANFQGKSLDTFVKVDILPASGNASTKIVLTNLRLSFASSLIFEFNNHKLNIVVEDIPYELRVLQEGDHPVLLGAPYHAKNSTRFQIYRMKIQGASVVVEEKLRLPWEVSLYSFDGLSAIEGAEFDLAALSPLGKLMLYKRQGDEYRHVWTSHEKYGGSANLVDVKVKDIFNRDVADYVEIPMGVHLLANGTSAPRLVVAENESLLKDVVGRKAMITGGKIAKLQWDRLGLSPLWVSKDLDGSILDYLVGASEGGAQLWVALRIRDQGFFEGAARKQSLLLVYDL